MYCDYLDDRYYWESVVMVRKFLVVVVVVFLASVGNDAQVTVALGVVVVALIAQMIMDPYR